MVWGLLSEARNHISTIPFLLTTSVPMLSERLKSAYGNQKGRFTSACGFIQSGKSEAPHLGDLARARFLLSKRPVSESTISKPRRQ